MLAVVLLAGVGLAQPTGDQAGEESGEASPTPAPEELTPATATPTPLPEVLPPVAEEPSLAPVPELQTTPTEPSEGDAAQPAVPAELPPAIDLKRRVEFYLAPSFNLMLDGPSIGTLGHVYGGHLWFKYVFWRRFSAEVSLGHLVGYQKQDLQLGYASYTRADSTMLSPFAGALNVEILPESRVNPYVGLGGGGAYLVLREDAESLESNVPLDHSELSQEIHKLLPMLVGKVGVDVRINEFVGVGCEALYRYIWAFSYDTSIPGASRTDNIDLGHVAFTLGITVYY